MLTIKGEQLVQSQCVVYRSYVPTTERVFPLIICTTVDEYIVYSLYKYIKK